MFEEAEARLGDVVLALKRIVFATQWRSWTWDRRRAAQPRKMFRVGVEQRGRVRSQSRNLSVPAGGRDVSVNEFRNGVRQSLAQMLPRGTERGKEGIMMG